MCLPNNPVIAGGPYEALGLLFDAASDRNGSGRKRRSVCRVQIPRIKERILDAGD